MKQYEQHTAILSFLGVMKQYEQHRYSKLFKGGLYHIFRKFDFFSSPCHNFFPLSSVQIIIIPACCLLCVL